MNAIYDTLGLRYATTRRADAKIVASITRLADLHLKGTYLDLACGSGNYSTALSRLIDGQWHGLDSSIVMLEQAKKQSSLIKWKVGNAENLPYTDNKFDAVICVNAIHFLDLARSFQEVYRVLNKGRFVIFSALSEQLENYWLINYFPNMIQRAMDSMPTQAIVKEYLVKSGFIIKDIIPFTVEKDITDFFLYSGKFNPELYLNSDIRNNMSQFSRLCLPEELDAGLSKLRHDITNGNFTKVSNRYSSIHGDCTYFVASKD